jgi:signal transduction histidine kinase
MAQPPPRDGLSSPGDDLTRVRIRRRLLLLLSASSGFIALAFLLYHLHLGRVDRALFSGSALALAILLMVVLHLSRDHRPALGLGSAYAVGVTLFLLGSPSAPISDCLWCFLVPPLITYAGGLRVARWGLPLYLLAAAAIVLRPGFAHAAHWSMHEQHVRFLGALLLTSLMAFFYEFNRQRALERLEAANEARARYLSYMSHDIRTPLASMIGTAEFLEMSHLDERQRHHLRVIQKSGQALSELVGDILDLARIDAGRDKPSLAPLCPRQLLEEVELVARPLAQARGLELQLEVDPGLPDPLLGDAARLRQILLNLVGNAIKYTDTGHVLIRLTPDWKHQRWRMEVMDSGIGIPADQHKRIFESFARVQDPATLVRPGTGLGLAICARLTQHLGGSIRMESEPRRGSTFTVELPLHERPPGPGMRA